MYFVYFIRSSKSNIVYVGMAKNVTTRLKAHNAGKTKFTKGHRPWEIIYVEGPFETQAARNREKFLKKSDNKKKILDNI